MLISISDKQQRDGDETTGCGHQGEGADGRAAKRETEKNAAVVRVVIKSVLHLWTYDVSSLILYDIVCSLI